MKIRSGFVSNSSSSSFIMRAAKFTQKELIEALGIEETVKQHIENDKEEYVVFEEICMNLPDDLDVEATGNYFGGTDYENIIVGQSKGELADGEVVAISDNSKEEDEKITEKLKSIGLKGELKTYIQMVSNDNY